MTENEKSEAKPAAPSSEFKAPAGGDSISGNSNNSEGAATASVSQNADNEEAASATPVVEPAKPVSSDYGASGSSGYGEESSSFGGSTQHEDPQRHTPMYVGLSILFILLLFYYNLTKSKEQAEKISEIGSSVSAIGSQIGGLDRQIAGFEKSVSKFERSILVLELKRSLVSVEEVISKSNDRTLDAAVRAKAALRSLIDSISASSAGARYRVKEISKRTDMEVPPALTTNGSVPDQVETPQNKS